MHQESRSKVRGERDAWRASESSRSKCLRRRARFCLANMTDRTDYQRIVRPALGHSCDPSSTATGPPFRSDGPIRAPISVRSSRSTTRAISSRVASRRPAARGRPASFSHGHSATKVVFYFPWTTCHIIDVADRVGLWLGGMRARAVPNRIWAVPSQEWDFGSRQNTIIYHGASQETPGQPVWYSKCHLVRV